MTSLLNSRWAPGNGASNSAQTHHHHPHHQPHPRRPRSENRIRSTPTSAPHNALLPPAEELARFMKIVSRLRWKLPFLAEGYRLATQADNSQAEAEAEIMFKIDFFEYYALLERAIVHLLAVFNIAVSSARGRVHTNASTNGTGTGTGYGNDYSNGKGAGARRNHPLAPVLGTGHVHELLRQAKELRNRWKTADMTRGELARDPVGDRDVVRPLASYDFEGILTGIFGGLEEGFVRAREHVDLCRKPGEEAVAGDEGWEFMVDAMDWEAV
ncbi:uncharacterized protein N7482_008804 [Penicillium canariense]|uniref:Uncharacterized protein n=1 Tax=Penicillium canariense TaxID=189055 RepID=A0A9W9HWK0_9EURO|nr:uncharacterized protein N7482_008804 [Penicillium canariense]KAJ5157704.1 hypothetical protein N7482_008804 [Penicillium canariense]